MDTREDRSDGGAPEAPDHRELLQLIEKTLAAWDRWDHPPLPDSRAAFMTFFGYPPGEADEWHVVACPRRDGDDLLDDSQRRMREYTLAEFRQQFTDAGLPYVSDPEPRAALERMRNLLLAELQRLAAAAGAQPEAAGEGAAEVDLSNYTQANRCLDQEHVRTFKVLSSVLEQNPSIRRYKPSPQRLFVHVGDWARYIQERNDAAWESGAVLDALESRTAKAAAEKKARK